MNNWHKAGESFSYDAKNPQILLVEKSGRVGFFVSDLTASDVFEFVKNRIPILVFDTNCSFGSDEEWNVYKKHESAHFIWAITPGCLQIFASTEEESEMFDD